MSPYASMSSRPLPKFNSFKSQNFFGTKHRSLMKGKTTAVGQIRDFCTAKAAVPKQISDEAELQASTSVADKPSTSTHSSLNTYFSGKDVMDAEILWCLKCIDSHYSYKSCNGIGELFQRMFPDSIIAKQISGSERKYAYLCHFGLAPYFHSILHKQLSVVHHYTLLFDESLNKTIQQKQLDIHVRYWHPDENCVRTQYITSAFIGHSTADDILKHFYECLIKLDLSKLLQISMAVNWKFYDHLQLDLKKEHNIQCISVGTCGLHILNNAFRKGASTTGWDIPSVLNALYFVFSDSPARRDDFLTSSTLKKMPLKFCNHRWLENGPASCRAYEIWKDVSNFVKLVESGKVSNKSFTILANATKDNLLPSKLLFFASVSDVIRPFMEFYQSDKPLLPFFSNDLHTLIKHCLTLFNVLKKDSIEKVSTSIKNLSEFDFADKSCFSSVEKVSAGFRADKLLKEMMGRKEVTESSVKVFKHDCQIFVVSMIEKLLSNCPINYSFVRNVSFLDPKYMVINSQGCHSKLKHILMSLAQKHQISEEECDAVLLEFNDFHENVIKPASMDFENFDSKSMRLDTFFVSYFNDGKKFQKLWKIIKMLLILSHGQASVERGFSVNKALEVENLKQDSYIAQRLVHEHIKYAGGVTKVNISKELRIAASAARSKYHGYLDEQRSKEKQFNQENKRKLKNQELSSLKLKKSCLEKDIKQSEELANSLCEQAECTSDFNLLKKSNKLRKTIKQKNDEISAINIKISEISKEL